MSGAPSNLFTERCYDSSTLSPKVLPAASRGGVYGIILAEYSPMQK